MKPEQCFGRCGYDRRAFQFGSGGIRHSKIESVQKSTGSVRNSGYVRVGKWFGSGWKDAEAALTAVTAKIADYVQNGPVAEDW